MYWFYKNWRALSYQAGTQVATDDPALRQFEKISPMLRTLGLVIPLVHIYLAFDLIYGIAKLNPDCNSFSHRHPLSATIILIGIMIALLMLVMLPGNLYLFSFLASIPLAVAQSWLNTYWQSIEPASVETRQMFTGRELMAITIGSLLLGFIVASPFITTQPNI